MNWRTYGDVPYDTFRLELQRVKSPMLADTGAIWDAARSHSALALAMMWVEQRYATFTESPIPADYHNPLSLAKPNGSTLDGVNRWEQFDSYADSVRAWKERLTSQTYKNGIYARTVTLADLVRVYAPPRDFNDTNLYIDTVQALLTKWPRIDQETSPVAGIALRQVMMAGCNTPVWIPAELAFRQEIIPVQQTNQRPGHAFRGGSASFYTQHDTGNTSFGAGAAMHSRYMHGGAIAYDDQGRPYSQQLGYHLTVDDKVLCQMIPLNEPTWHGGDSGGDGNMDSVACELTINPDSDHVVSRRYAAIVAAGVSEALGIPREPVQHNYWSGKDCPQEMRRTGTWNGYLAVFRTARAQMSGAAPAPTYAPAIILDLGIWDGKDRTLPDGTVLRACKRVVMARRTTKRLQVAAAGSPEIGPPLKKGEDALIEYVFQAKAGGSRYGYSQYGTRFKLADFNPYIVISPKG